MARDFLHFRQAPGGKRVAIRPGTIEAVMEHENGHTVIVTGSDTYQVAEPFDAVLARAAAVVIGDSE